MVRAPERCPHGHRLMPDRMLLGSIACSVAGLTWRCDATAAPSPTGHRWSADAAC